MMGHPRNTMMIPMKKNEDPLILWRWKKKKNVFSIPIRNPNPHKNSSWKLLSQLKTHVSGDISSSYYMKS